MGVPIEPPEVEPPGADGPAHPVTSGVALIVGVRRCNDRRLDGPGGAEPGIAHREFGRQMDQVGSEAGEVGGDLGLVRSGPLHLRGEKEGPPGTSMDLGPVCHPVPQRVRRGVDPELVPPSDQRVGGPGERGRDTADHRPVHLGKHGDSHRDAPIRWLRAGPRAAGPTAPAAEEPTRGGMGPRPVGGTRRPRDRPPCRSRSGSGYRPSPARSGPRGR